MADAKPYVLIDVDGVLNPFYARECPAGFTLHQIEVRGRTYPVRLNPEHGPMLLALAEATGAELAWGTTWEDDANASIGPVIGLPELPVAPLPRSFRARSKAEGIVPWTAGRPFVWFEDEPSEAEDAAIHAAPEQRHTVLWVDPQTGLTAAHIAEAQRWLRELSEVAA